MSAIALFTDLDGRIGRRQFWLGSIALMLGLLAVQWTAPRLLGSYEAAVLVAFAKTFCLFPWSVLAAKRAADRGGSAVFGIALVCAIVLPTELQPLAGLGIAPSLIVISTMAWLVALVDLGLMPGVASDTRLAEQGRAAKPTG